MTTCERLVALLKEADIKHLSLEDSATFLIENGIIVLPVKVGDTVYKVWYTECHNGETHPDSCGCCGCEDECDMHKTIIEIIVPNVRFILDNLMDMNNSVYFLTYNDAVNALNK